VHGAERDPEERMLPPTLRMPRMATTVHIDFSKRTGTIIKYINEEIES
jgi:hypothetical protein